MAKALKFDKLVDFMKKKDCLGSWDCMVAYDEDKLNHLLEKRASTLNDMSTVPDYSTTTKVAGHTLTYTLKLKLGPPHITFNDTLANVSVVLKLSGTVDTGFDKEAPETFTIPEGVDIVVTTSLVNVFGTGAAMNTTKAKTVVVMDVGATEEHNICIDFLTPSSVELANHSGATGDPVSQITTYNETIKTLVSGFLKEKGGLRYVLAGVKNDVSPDPKAPSKGILRPSKFVFSTMPKVLLIYIAIQDSWTPDGQTKGGQGGSALTNFGGGTETTSPIPLDCSASIVFSHYIIVNAFLLPGLKDSKCTDAKDTTLNDTSGTSVSAKLEKKNLTLPRVAEDNIGSSWSVNALTFSIDEPATTFELQPDVLGENQMKISWPGSTYEIGWGSDNHWSEAGMESGTLKLSVSFSGQASWESSKDPKTSNALNLAFAIDKYFKIVPSGAGTKTTIGGFFNGSSNVLPPQYQTPSLEVPSIKLNMDPLNYFLTTNLIIPGYHVFTAHDPKDGKDGSKGIATPRDTIITGTIAEKLETSATTATDSIHTLAMPLASVSSTSDPELPTVQADLRNLHLELSAKPPKPILGDLLQALETPKSIPGAVSEADNLKPTVATVLAKYGYGKLSGDDIAAPLGWSWNSFCAQVASVSDGISSTLQPLSTTATIPAPLGVDSISAMDVSTPTFDISTFNGVYKPSLASLPSTRIVVYPPTANVNDKTQIECDDEIVWASDASTTTTPRQATWKTAKGTYLVQFSTKVNKNTQSFYYAFEGTRDGQQISYTQETSFADFIEDGGIVFGAIGTLFGIAVFLWQTFSTRAKDNAKDAAEKKKADDEEKARKDFEDKEKLRVEGEVKKFEAWTQKNADRYAKSLVKNGQLDWKEYGKSMISDVDEAFDAEMQALDQADSALFEKHLEEYSTTNIAAQSFFKDLTSKVESRVQQKLYEFGHDKINAPIQSFLATLSNAHLIDDTTENRIIRDAIQSQAGEFAKKLSESGTPGTKRLLDYSVAARLRERAEAKQTASSIRIGSDIQTAVATLRTKQAAETAATNSLTAYQGTMPTDPLRVTEAQKAELARLQTAEQTAQREVTKAQNDLTLHQNEMRENVHREQENSKESLTERQREAREMKREFP